MARRSSLTLLVALTLIGCEGANPSTSNAQARTLPPAPAKPLGPVPAQTLDASRRTAITTAVERVAPAVVTVQTETVQKVPVDFFEYFMGGRTGERRNAGIGSGFIVRRDGIIVTNAHVISGATKVSIGMRDGTSYDATVVGIDETNDLAVVRIKATDLPVAPLGSSLCGGMTAPGCSTAPGLSSSTHALPSRCARVPSVGRRRWSSVNGRSRSATHSASCSATASPVCRSAS
jgi:serine protease Do